MAKYRLGISGHRGLPSGTTKLVEAALRDALAGYGRDLIGVTCLADGADMLFAQVVLDQGGSIEVIVPAAAYRQNLPAACWERYDALLAQASTVHRLDYIDSTSEAHMAASRLMLQTISALIAVWDGQPARGYGGTADVVTTARQQGIPTTVIWPAGANRDADPVT